MRDHFAEVGAAMRAEAAASVQTLPAPSCQPLETPRVRVSSSAPQAWDGRYARKLIELHPYAARRFYIPVPTPDAMDRVVVAISVGGLIGFSALMLAGVL